MKSAVLAVLLSASAAVAQFDPCDIPISALPTPVCLAQSNCQIDAWLKYRLCLNDKPEGYPEDPAWCIYCAAIFWEQDLLECTDDCEDDRSTEPCMFARDWRAV